ncbi:uncharacterized protein AB675_2426 [Cyphellophora attinorum]|uniref:Uncharacterized protein n=1 Tax=Cyphellophora attinorum TaxID=1664694 RepID=A0A0N0NRI0_9EURO|nr:uncharacterized protein AB675_2426 [Phialophora attinorum]KPI45111.1 hypothetical protein AB675_2426 [Phialophora attinorum]
MEDSILSKTPRRHVCFSKKANESEIDVKFFLFDPEDAISPTSTLPTSSNARNSDLDSAFSSSSSESLASSCSSQSSLDSVNPRITAEAALNRRSICTFAAVTAQPLRNSTSFPSQSRHIIDASLDSPVEIELDDLSESITRSRPNTVHIIARPKAVYIPHLNTTSLVEAAILENSHPSKAKTPLDLVEPPTRFTQILIMPPAVLGPLTSSLEDDWERYAGKGEVWIDSSSPAQQLLVRSSRSLRSRIATLAKVAKRQMRKLRNIISGRRSSTAPMEDIEAQARQQPRQTQLKSILRSIDEQVEKAGGVAFNRDDSSNARAHQHAH